MATPSRRALSAAALLLPAQALAATQPTPETDRAAWLDALAGTTGRVATPTESAPSLEDLAWLTPAPQGMRALTREVIRVDGAPWIRLAFDGADLPVPAGTDLGAAVRITSLFDGASQLLDATRLDQWSDTSAYFVGDAVVVEVLIDEHNAEPAWISTDAVIVGVDPALDRSLCGNDDRVISTDPRDARLMPEGCTAYLFNRRTNDLLTAGHCDFLPGSVVQFNTPLSSSGGSPLPPDPEDQYPVDFDSTMSSQTVGGVFIGNDWAVFGVFDNADTGLTPLAAQGASRVLADTVPNPDGRPIRITGYGTVRSPISPTLNQAQKTDVGSYVSRDGNVIRYNPDTTGGNSGSAVIDDSTGMTIGVHTNAGCATVGNQGTALSNANLQNALRNPQGISRGETVAITFPAGLPDTIPSTGASVELDIRGSGGGVLQAGTAMVHIDTGAGFMPAVPMTNMGGDFFADLPAADCGSVLRVYFSAETTEGRFVTDPPAGASDPYYVLVASATTSLLDADPESLTGWSTAGPVASNGGWGTGAPAGESSLAPDADYNGTGTALLTGPTGMPVNDGLIVLTSPAVDLSGASAPALRFASWWATTQLDDAFVAQYSTDNGASWIDLEAPPELGAWRFRQWDIASLLGNPAQLPAAFRVRFAARDFNNNSIAEAGVDAFDIVDTSCGGCLADIAAPLGTFDFFDVLEYLARFDAADSDADLAAPFGELDFFDVLAFLALAEDC